MPRKTRVLGTLDGAKKLTWKALKRAAELLEDGDPQVALKAAHAVFQGATAYAKLHEVAELEKRVAALENAVENAMAQEPRRRWTA